MVCEMVHTRFVSNGKFDEYDQVDTPCLKPAVGVTEDDALVCVECANAMTEETFSVYLFNSEEGDGKR